MKANHKLYCFILVVLWHVNVYGQIGTIGNEDCYCSEDTTGHYSKSFFSENSRWLPNKGIIRVFVVFAEALNDPHYNDFDSRWPAGQMPANASSYFDADYNPNNIQGFITKYYHQASFGEFIVLGD